MFIVEKGGRKKYENALTSFREGMMKDQQKLQKEFIDEQKKLFEEQKKWDEEIQRREDDRANLFTQNINANFEKMLNSANRNRYEFRRPVESRAPNQNNFDERRTNEYDLEEFLRFE